MKSKNLISWVFYQGNGVYGGMILQRCIQSFLTIETDENNIQ